MFRILITVILTFIFLVPFFSTPVGEELYLEYQDTDLYKSIYCQYVEWFGAEGFDKIKFAVKCQLLK
ncbi:hypothetical protein ACRXCV_05630 [Halobacteriovorax sp. GFR7]|uniref:hypothetical protein n=1 Tax=unclassified Halobacteriovorax TaxID=2639665 RepID=UPI0037157946